MSKKILIISIALMLTGCLEPEVRETTREDANNLVNSLVYVKASNGLCFGVTSTFRVSSNGTGAFNNLIVNVPCEKLTND